MIGQYKKKLVKLKDKLNYLHDNLNDYNALLSLQLEIIDNIRKIEFRIRKLKQNNKDATKGQIALSVFKSFGDGIAFSYLDTHNLKQMTYDTETLLPKNESGFISDKIGFDNELTILKEIINNNIPCVLCDITNSLRYGDIVILVGPDPYIIECKTSNKKSGRNLRQKNKLLSLAEYYSTDMKTIKHGTIDVARTNLANDPIRYINDLNQLINIAQKEQSASKQIEKGLYYFVFTNTADISIEMSKYKIREAFPFFLNSYKEDRTWLSYIPYVLLITDSTNLVDFITGKIIIVIIIDVNEINKIAHKLGLKFESQERSENPFEFYKFEKDKKEASGMFALSYHYITRVGLEAVSLEWLISNANHMYFNKTDLTTAST